MDTPFYKQCKYLLLMAAVPAVFGGLSIASGFTAGVYPMAGIALMLVSLAARQSTNPHFSRYAGLILSIAFFALVYGLVRMLDIGH